MAERPAASLENLSGSDLLYFEALLNHDIALMRIYANRGSVSHINLKDANGKSMAHCAAEMGDTDCLGFFFDNGVSINEKTADGKSFLYYAIRENKPLTLSFLLEKGVDLDEKIDGLSPHEYARTIGRDEMADVIGKRRQRKLDEKIARAVMDNDFEKTRDLLDSGADIEARMPDDRESYHATLLNYAAFKGYGPIVRLLIDRGADVNAPDCDGDTPLSSVVVCSKDLGILGMLMEAGADPLIENLKGENARDRAGNNAAMQEVLSRRKPVYGADEIAFERVFGNRHLEEVFNFTNQERITLLRRHKYGAVEAMTREKFTEIDTDILSSAFNSYAARGGNIDRDKALRSVMLGGASRKFARKP